MEPVLAVCHLTRDHIAGGRTVHALRDICFDVPKGQFVALIGPSGSGKTTLLNILGGLDLPTSGEVWVAGERVDMLSETKRALLRRRRISYVFQFFNLMPGLSAEENVALPVLLNGRSPAEATRRAAEVLGQVGLSGFERALPGDLSGGEQQRVAIARALACTPDVILADEPTGNLDSIAATAIGELLRDVTAGGQTLIVATHDARLAARADRVMNLRDGAIAGDEQLAGTSPAHPLRLDSLLGAGA